MNVMDRFLLPWEALVYLLNVAVIVCLICVVGLFLVRVCLRCSAPVRHGILASTLGLTLIAPWLVVLGQQRGIGLIRHSLGPSVPASQPAEVALFAETSTSDVPKRESKSDEPAPAEIPSVASSFPSPTTSKRDGDTLEATRPKPEAIGSGAVALEATSGPSRGSQSVVALASGRPFARDSTCWWRRVGSLVALVWCMGICVGLARLARGFRLVSRLRKSLEERDDPRLRDLAGFVGQAVGLRETPALRFSFLAPLPLVLGFIRPVIVLPSSVSEEMDDGQLKAVLIHEAAHVARCDHWLGLCQQAAKLLYWWNPLMKRMNEQMNDVREDVCDNHVLRSQGDAVGFARVLVETAARVGPRRAIPLTTGVLSSRTQSLPARILRLVERGRDTATRVSWVGRGALAMFVAAGILGISCVGGFRAAGGETPAEASSVAEQDGGRSVLLHVVDEDGKPIVGAKVRWEYGFMGEAIVEKEVTFTSNAQGEVRFLLPKKAPNVAVVSVSAQGRVPVGMVRESMEQGVSIPSEMTVPLKRGRTIGGLVRDKKGAPIEGVQVKLACRHLSSRSDGFSPWFDECIVETNQAGEWRFDGIQREFNGCSYSLHIDFVAEGHASTWDYCDWYDVVTRLSSLKNVTEMEPGYSVHGRVTDTDGKAIVGAQVVCEMDAPTLSTQTDADGRYRIEGCRAGKGAVGVSAEGWAHQSLEHAIEIDETPKAVDFQLVKGRTLEFRVINENGKPVPEVWVSAQRANVARDLDLHYPHWTDAEGKWRWTGASDQPIEIDLVATSRSRQVALVRIASKCCP